MKKVQLNVFDTNRLTELVSIYMNPPGEFLIYNNGEVSVNKSSYIKRKLGIRNDSTMDFLSVSQTIADKLMIVKENNPLVQALCGQAIGILIDTNNRSEVIKKLYLAHLADKDLSDITLLKGNNNNNNRVRGEITKVEIVESRQLKRPDKIQIYDNREIQRTLAQNIADEMNEADVVIIKG